MGVELHIGELVLHGFAARDRHSIAKELETELARLIGEGSLPGAREHLSAERMHAGAFKVPAGAKPQAAGAQIAQAVYRSLRQQTRTSAGSPVVRTGAGAPRA